MKKYKCLARKREVGSVPWRSKSRQGAAHSVTLLVALPSYLLISVFAIEMLLLFVSHISLLAATDRAVNQVQNWLPHREALRREGRSLEQQVHREVCRSLVPYAITRDNGTSSESLRNELETQLRETRFDAKMVAHYGNRWDRIFVSTRATIGPLEGRGPYRTVKLRLEYDAPLWTPWFSRIFGVPSRTNSGIYVHTLVREVEVPILMSDWERTNVGIGYDPFLSKK
jgi:hypothetical protein